MGPQSATEISPELCTPHTPQQPSASGVSAAKPTESPSNNRGEAHKACIAKEARGTPPALTRHEQHLGRIALFLAVVPADQVVGVRVCEVEARAALRVGQACKRGRVCVSPLTFLRRQDRSVEARCVRELTTCPNVPATAS